MTIHLSALGMAHILFDDFPIDFTFHVGQQEYKTSAFIALFLSPKLCRLRHVDPTICEYRVLTQDDVELFGSFLSLCTGRDFVVTSANRSFVLSIAKEFENAELAGLCLDWHAGELNCKSAAESLDVKISLGIGADAEINFLASHFHETKFDALKGFHPSVLSRILSQQSLVLSSEDSLYEFISSLLPKNDEFFGLFEFVEFSCLSESSARSFVAVCRSRLCLLTVSIWERLGDRLVSSSEKNKESTRYVHRGREFVPDASAPLGGIIAHLTAKCGGNVADKGIVGITSLTNYPSPGYTARNLADLTNDNHFCSSAAQTQSVTYDFKQMNVIPTHYTIRAHCGGQGSYHMKSWVIEASLDGEAWEAIDRRDNDAHLNGYHFVHSYEVTKIHRARYIRIAQTGPTHDNRYYLGFSAFELFGRLIE